MENQAQTVTVLHAEAGMMLCIALIVLIAHLTSRRQKANDGGFWYGLSALSGSLGLFLLAEAGRLGALVAIIAVALFLGHVVLLTFAVTLVTRQSLRAVLWVAVESVLVLGLLAFSSVLHVTHQGRMLITEVGHPLLLVPAIVLLLRTPDKVIRPATRLLAMMLAVFGLGLLVRAARLVFLGVPLPGADWGATIFIAGEALCFFWVDMLRLSAELESQAMTDPLTGLMNRRAMETFALRELARCHRQQQAIAALMIDLDDFKQVNDLHGHSMGDEALQRIACVIRESVRTVDLAARMGGDEFLVLLPDASELAVDMVTARLRDAIAQLRVPTRGGEFLTLSATIGQTRSLRGDTTLQDLIQHSDTDLYAQKQGDRAAAGDDVTSPGLDSERAAYAD